MSKSEDIAKVGSDKKIRKSSGPSKSELREQNEKMQQQLTDKTLLDVKGMSYLRKGLFHLLESVTNLPYTKTDEEMSHSLDEGLVNCLNVYGGAAMAQWGPAIQASLAFSMITLNAYSKKTKQSDERNISKDIKRKEHPVE